VKSQNCTLPQTAIRGSAGPGGLAHGVGSVIPRRQTARQIDSWLTMCTMVSVRILTFEISARHSALSATSRRLAATAVTASPCLSNEHTAAGQEAACNKRYTTQTEVFLVRKCRIFLYCKSDSSTIGRVSE